MPRTDLIALVSLVLALVSFAVSLGQFFWQILSRGGLKGWAFNLYGLARSASGTGITRMCVPVSLTDTGAHVRTVTGLWGRLRSGQDGDHIFAIQTELDSIPPSKKAPLAASFHVPARTNVVKLIAFASWEPHLALGVCESQFEIFPEVEGHIARRPCVSFTIAITDQAVADMSRGGMNITFPGKDRFERNRS